MNRASRIEMITDKIIQINNPVIPRLDRGMTGLRRWMEIAGEQAESPTLIYGGAESYGHDGVNVVSWEEFGKRDRM